MQTEPINIPVPSTTIAGLDPTHRRTRRHPILPESIKSPVILIWVGIVPQLVLLLLNLRDYHLVAGEMTRWQKGMALTIGGFEVGLLIGMAALTIFLRFPDHNISLLTVWLRLGH